MSAPYEELEGQLDMWSDFATPAANSVRAKNKPPEPDADGFFDAAGVREICGRRQCSVAFASEYAATVTHKTKLVSLTAIAPGKWDPVSILKACSAACDRQSFDVDEATAKPQCELLDELKIARIVGADGVRPYLSKSGKHYRRADQDGGTTIQRPIPRSYVAERYTIMPDTGMAPAEAGYPTWAFLNVLCIQDAPDSPMGSYPVRRALRSLEDVGLVKIDLGPRGGMATAKVTWSERALLPKPRPRPAALDSDDDRALECLSLGIA